MSESPRQELSFRYKLVRFLAAVAAFVSVPALLLMLFAAGKNPSQVFATRESTLAYLGAIVEMLLAIPVYIAVKQRRRAGFLALLFAQGSVIIQKSYVTLFKTPEVAPIQGFIAGSQVAGIVISIIWLGILISIKDELDQ